MIAGAAIAAPGKAIYSCGPVRLELAFTDTTLHEALRGLLTQYDAPWLESKTTIHATITSESTATESPENAGSYLALSRLKVDRCGSQLVSFGNLGSFMQCDLTVGEAHITVPNHPDWASLVEEVEQHFVLLLARAWAQAGWTPLHGGTLLPPGETRCLMLCAPSGVGKTTLTAALLRRGWQTLGDDKTLLRPTGSGVVARALAQRFHLHPLSSRWFPEAGDISAWPTYSRWTDKRVVRIEQLWPGCLKERAIPGAIVQLERNQAGPALTIEPLDRLAILNALLRQVAIPNDAEHARPLVACLALLAGQIRGALVKIGHDAFVNPATAERLEGEFKQLLS